MRKLTRTAACAVAAFAVVAGCGPGLAPVIRDELARAPRGTATVVFFTDFQCPFCRRTHAALAPIVAERGGAVRVVLRHVPLPNHPDARAAARAAVCGELLGARAQFVHALFEAPDVGEAACEVIAVEHGVDRGRFAACVADPVTDARIARDIAMFHSIGGDGVPVLFVGRARLEGSQPRAVLETAVDDALDAAR